jgi:hypothetical protein
MRSIEDEMSDKKVRGLLWFLFSVCALLRLFIRAVVVATGKKGRWSP